MASYAYDYLGRRISRTIYGSPNVTIRYAYDGDRIIAEYDGSGTLRRKFVYGPGLDEPICLIDVANGNAAYYYHLDGLGSVVALSNVNKVLVERYAYDVFGRPTIRDPNGVVLAASAWGNPYLFTGRAYDGESGLYYYRARYYDYATGRFLQPDPIGYDDGLNLYAYVGNRPCGFVDPSGLCKKDSVLAQRADRSIRSLYGFTLGVGQSLSAFKEGLTQLFIDPLGTLEGIPSSILGIPDALQQFYADITSPDPFVNGNAVGRLTGSTEVGIVTSAVGGRIVRGPARDFGSTPGGRPFTKHYALDTGPQRNIPMSVLDNTIDTVDGLPIEGQKVVYYDPVNNVTVVTGRGNSIVSSRKGPPRANQR